MFTKIIQIKLGMIILIALVSAGAGILLTCYLRPNQAIVNDCSLMPKKSWAKPYKATMTGKYY